MTPCLKGIIFLRASGKSTAGRRAPPLPAGVKLHTHTHLPVNSHLHLAPPLISMSVFVFELCGKIRVTTTLGSSSSALPGKPLVPRGRGWMYRTFEPVGLSLSRYTEGKRRQQQQQPTGCISCYHQSFI